MTDKELAAAAERLARARRTGERIDHLPVQPANVAEAHAIQDRVTALLGEAVDGFKANAPPNDQPTRGVIYARAIHPSPARIAPEQVPDMGVEGEIAFRFTRDLPSRATPYTRAEISAAVQALPAIEVMSSRFHKHSAPSALEKLADCISNGAFVPGVTVPDWERLELSRLRVCLLINGEPVLDHNDGHPTGDPLGVAVALVNMMRDGEGVRAGQFVTTGSCTGLRFLQAGDRCKVTFEGLGSAEVTFTG